MLASPTAPTAASALLSAVSVSAVRVLISVRLVRTALIHNDVSYEILQRRLCGFPCGVFALGAVDRRLGLLKAFGLGIAFRGVIKLVLMHRHRSRVLLRIMSLLFVRLGFAPRVLRARIVLSLVHRVLVNDDPAAMTALALGREGLHQPGAQALTGHLHQAQRGNLRNLVAGAVAAQGLLQAAQDQVLVFWQDHIDKVHHNHAAQITQAHLAHDFFGCLEVIAGYRFL